MTTKKIIEQFVERARKGEKEAFNELVTYYQDLVVAYALGLTGDFQAAQDAAQEAFTAAYLKLPQLRQPQAFLGWLRQIVRTCARLQRQNYHPQEMGTLPTAATDPQSSLNSHELQRFVRQLMDDLPQDLRTVTTLFYMAGCRQKEIAAFLGVPLSTVEKRLQYAREQLRAKALETMQQDLERVRPSCAEHFANEVQELLLIMLEDGGGEFQLTRRFLQKNWPDQCAAVGPEGMCYLLAAFRRTTLATGPQKGYFSPAPPQPPDKPVTTAEEMLDQAITLVMVCVDRFQDLYNEFDRMPKQAAVEQAWLEIPYISPWPDSVRQDLLNMVLEQRV